jgi:hypothetical protein
MPSTIYDYMLGKSRMTKRSGGITIPSSNSVSTTDNTQDCPTCACCSTSQVDLHHAEAMVLCCMDFRLRDNMVCQLNLKNYRDNYDEVIAAGASLGYNGLKSYSGWNTFVDEHISLAYSLHSISEIIVIDHEKCGAYSAQYSEQYGGTLTKEQEYDLHVENLIKCANALWVNFNPTNGKITPIPNLKIITYIISIDGCNLTEIYERTS